jgi:hypothetical protein
MAKKKKPPSAIDSASIMYAAWLLLHMEKNGLLENNTVEDKAVPLDHKINKALSDAIKTLEKKVLSTIRLVSTNKKIAAEIEQRALDTVERFFATGLHRTGVIPALIFGCILFAWFVEGGRSVPPVMGSLTKPQLYDDIFLAFEDVDEASWSTHSGAAIKAISPR